MVLRPTNSEIIRSERGVALLIVLLVTALLIALVFEFSYATRISLNSAVNFRNSERAYFLARAGIIAFKGANGASLRDTIEVAEWHPLPIGDIVVEVKWEDESGKIKINDIKRDNTTKTVATTLFENIKEIDRTVLDRITDESSQISNLSLLSGLNEYMNYEDFDKVGESLTVFPVSMNMVAINVNTAPVDVLQSLGISKQDAERIKEDRKENPYAQSDIATSGGRLSGIVANITGSLGRNPLTVASRGYYKIYARVNVEGYIKQVEAVVNGSNIVYWKAL